MVPGILIEVERTMSNSCLELDRELKGKVRAS